MNHNHIIVDLFVMLGGFVLAASTEDKLSRNKVGILSFCFKRFIRLFPMVLFGVFFGTLLVFIFKMDFFLKFKSIIGIDFILNLLLFPFFYQVDGMDGYVSVSDPPLATIFYQMGITYLWAYLFPGCKRNILIMFTALSGVLLAFIAFTLKDVNLGWGGPHAIWGYVRTFYDFFMGVLIYRFSEKLPYHKVMPFLVVFLIVFMSIFPFEGNIARGLVFFIFPPLVLLLGACCGDRKIIPINGNVAQYTYSIYVCHYLVLFLFACLLGTNNSLWILCLVLPICLIFSVCVRIFYDVPVTRFLKNKFDHVEWLERVKLPRLELIPLCRNMWEKYKNT